MSVEFRQRKPGELIGMLKRQKWLIMLPMITMTAAIGYVVYKLPSIYESTSLLDRQTADDLVESRSVSVERGPLAASSDDQPGSAEPFVAGTDGSEIRPLQAGTGHAECRWN